MSTLVTAIHITTCILLILVVLIQSGKGAEISTSLGGSSQTVFGSSGGANFFTRFTSVMAAIFMTTSLVLTMLGSQAQKSVFEGMTAPAAKTAPANPTPAAPAAASATTPAAQNAAPATQATAPTEPAKK